MILDKFSLKGKKAIITGASSGIGAAAAVAFAEAGASVALAGRRADRLAETAQLVAEAGGTAVVVQTDVAKSADCYACVERTVAELGGLDILVNNAGIGTSVPTLRESDAEFDEVIAINLRGSYLMARESARVMPRGSSIINISSVLAMVSAALPQAAYSASKAGLLGMTRDLAQQWSARRGIRVNAVLPGVFATEMTAAYAPEYVADLLSRIPAGRYGDPAEYAAALIFLASDAANYITGASIPVDGGFSIR